MALTVEAYEAHLSSHFTSSESSIASLLQKFTNGEKDLREEMEEERGALKELGRFIRENWKLVNYRSQDTKRVSALKEKVKWLELRLTEETFFYSLEEEDIPGADEIVDAYDITEHMQPNKAATLHPSSVSGIPAMTRQEFSKNMQSTPASSSLPEAKKEFLPKVSYDPTTAKYFEEFQQEPSEEAKRDFSFVMKDDELKLFKQNGFVVSERLGAKSFAKVYYKTYSDHLPVFLSADSILHAWHYSFDKVMDFVEQKVLTPILMRMLFAMRRSVVVRAKEEEQKESKGDAEESREESRFHELDFFLGVAMSFLCGAIVAGELGQGKRIYDTIRRVQEGGLGMLSVFGEDREFDYSMLTVRGRYTTTEQLTRYFKTMMWLAAVDFRVAGERANIKELEAACALVDLMIHSEQVDSWFVFEDFFTKLIGVADSMTFIHLYQILQHSGHKNLVNLSRTDLDNIQKIIMKSDVGMQAIQGGVTFAGEGMSRSFTMLGQKFVFDSWAMGQVVFENIIDPNGDKVLRRIPSALDVAYSVLLNPNVAPLLSRRMADKDGLPFRDGLDYTRNLLAVRATTQNLPPKIWDSSIYFQWLRTLQSLSDSRKEKNEEKPMPEVFRTEAWAMREVNTQLASWTQLRHDTVLYAKGYYCGSSRCLYPDGYVEPKVAFWKQITKMAQSMADAMQLIPLPSKESRYAYDSVEYKLNQVVEFYQGFVEIMEKITEIAEKQEKCVPLSFKEIPEKEYPHTSRAAEHVKEMADNWFLNSIMDETFGSGGTMYAGWYPRLFIWDERASGRAKYTVSDVFTDLPDPLSGDQGCVLHEGVGRINIQNRELDSGSGPVCYAGPVHSHYEFTRGTAERLTDKQWKGMVNTYTTPLPSPWSSSFLVQGQKEKKPKELLSNYPSIPPH